MLRPDSTAPIARLATTRLKQSSKPIRLYYNQRVYRQKGMYSGKSIETCQMGVELIGANTLQADMEMLQLAMEVLENCALSEYRIELGHGGLCEILIGRLQVGVEIKAQIKQFIQAKNYPALHDALDQLGQGNEIMAIKALPGLFGGEEVFAQAEKVFRDNETLGIINYMHALYTIFHQLEPKAKTIIDLGFAHDNDYYTGIIFQAYIQGLGEAVLLGGRYDRLLERFGESLPAIGFGANIDLLAKNRMNQGDQVDLLAPQVLVWGEPGFLTQSMLYAKALRRDSSIVVENALFDSFDGCKAYAAARGISQIHVVGESVKQYVIP